MPKKHSKKKVKRVLDTMNASMRLAGKKFGPLHPDRDPEITDEGSLFHRRNKVPAATKTKKGDKNAK